MTNANNQADQQLAAPTSTPRKEGAGIVKRGSSYTIDPLRLTYNTEYKPGEKLNTRFDMGDIEALAESILTELKRDPSRGGLLAAIRVKRIPKSDPRSAEFDFEGINGERRYTAIMYLIGKGVKFPEGIAADLVDQKQDPLTSLIQMFTLNTSKAMLPLEEAHAFKRMRDAKMTLKEIAKACGKGMPQVNAALALLEAAPELQDAVKKGEVTATDAKAIAVSARGNKAKQAELLADAKVAKGNGKNAKAAKSKLKASLNKTRQTNAAAKGKTIKMRALDDVQLGELGSKVAKMLEVKAKEARTAYNADDLTSLLDIIKKDEMLAMAFTVGACQALKAAAGLKTDLDI